MMLSKHKPLHVSHVSVQKSLVFFFHPIQKFPQTSPPLDLPGLVYFPCSLCPRQAGLGGLQLHQAYLCLRAFAPAVSSAWKPLLPLFLSLLHVHALCHFHVSLSLTFPLKVRPLFPSPTWYSLPPFTLCFLPSHWWPCNGFYILLFCLLHEDSSPAVLFTAIWSDHGTLPVAQIFGEWISQALAVHNPVTRLGSEVWSIRAQADLGTCIYYCLRCYNIDTGIVFGLFVLRAPGWGMCHREKFITSPWEVLPEFLFSENLFICLIFLLLWIMFPFPHPFIPPLPSSSFSEHLCAIPLTHYSALGPGVGAYLFAFQRLTLQTHPTGTRCDELHAQVWGSIHWVPIGLCLEMLWCLCSKQRMAVAATSTQQKWSPVPYS